MSRFFDGSGDDYIELASGAVDVADTSAWTCLIFFRVADTDADECTLVNIGSASGQGLGMRVDSGVAPQALESRQGGSLQFATTDQIEENTWYVAAMSNDGLDTSTSMTLRVLELDGTVLATATGDHTNPGSAVPGILTMGRPKNNSSDPMHGDLAYFAYFDSELTEGDIQDYVFDPVSFVSTNSNANTAFLPLNGSSPEPDQSGNGNNGTVVGTPTSSSMPPLASSGLELAFPGAEGAGAYSQGGKGGTSISVTSLADSGPGTLREACENVSGPRIIEFNVSGYIDLDSPIKIQNPYVTIDGSTAPSGGVCVRENRVIIQTHNVIIRYIRFRLGDNFTQAANVTNSLFINYNTSDNPEPDGDVHDVIIDHCSLSWSVDTNLGIWNSDWSDSTPANNVGLSKIRNVTVQWCIFSEPLNNSLHPEGPHGMNLLVGGGATDITIHHCLFAHSPKRNPQIKGGRVDCYNNVEYNCGDKFRGGRDSSSSGVDLLYMNWIGNYQIDGVDAETDRMVVLTTGSGSDGCTTNRDHLIYLDNNISPDRTTDTGDEWVVTGCDSSGGPEISAQYRAGGIFTWLGPIEYFEDVFDAYDAIVSHCGCSKPGRDDIDVRVMGHVENKTGGQVIDSQDDVGGYPALTSFVTVPEWPPATPDPPAEEPETAAPFVPIVADFLLLDDTSYLLLDDTSKMIIFEALDIGVGCINIDNSSPGIMAVGSAAEIAFVATEPELAVSARASIGKRDANG